MPSISPARDDQHMVPVRCHRFIGGFTLASLVTFGEIMDHHIMSIAGTPVGFSSLIILVSTISSAKRQVQSIGQTPRMDAIAQRL
ncbi:hypothetical protein CYMTET_55705 [Cymbomonas tetramitiformis]|uniref:Uncharacterized protein n=1 Tax=Cymbomonas tetramitiformis TaxID=36881 RepID=A0AAE0EMP9_9CHLO|nr:hypothetical protein CYMTET_55705 [Cymbomonas tetramitiformis]